jgi:hypothetical protein
MLPTTRIPGSLGLIPQSRLQFQLQSHLGKPLTPAQEEEVNLWEARRKATLPLAIWMLADFAERVTKGKDPSISGKDPSKLQQFDKKDANIIKGFRNYLSLFPTSLDWERDNKSSTVYPLQREARQSRHLQMPTNYRDSRCGS